MDSARKITVAVPAELLAKAQRASGAGITQPVRKGLELIAASQGYADLRSFRAAPGLPIFRGTEEGMWTSWIEHCATGRC